MTLAEFTELLRAKHEQHDHQNDQQMHRLEQPLEHYGLPNAILRPPEQRLRLPLQQHPQSVDAKRGTFTVAKEWLADLLLYQGRIKDATRRIEQVMRTTDNAQSRGAYLAYLAQVYAVAGDERLAAKFANETALALPDPSSLVKAALVLASLGHSSGVERLLKGRTDLTHNSLSAANDHLIRGVLAMAKGDTNSGIEEIRLATDLNPREEEAAYRLGVAYFRNGDYESALRTFRTVMGLKGTVLLDNVPFLVPVSDYRIAQCYEHLVNSDSARASYAEVAKLWSDADQDLRRRYRPGGR